MALKWVYVFAPWGAAAGALVGHWVDTRSDGDRPNPEEFGCFAVFALYAAAANSSGSLRPRQRERLINYGLNLFPDRPNHWVQSQAAILAQQPVSLHEYAQVFRAFDDRTQFSVAATIWSILHADGRIDDSEFGWMEELVAATGQTTWDVWNTTLAFFVRENSDEANGPALEVLGLSSGATVEEIKDTYLKRINDYSYHKLKNLPYAIRNLAADKLKDLTNAYEALTAAPVRSNMVLGTNGEWLEAAGCKRGDLTTCYLCGQTNRLAGLSTVMNSRCGSCSALLALPERLVTILEP